MVQGTAYDVANVAVRGEGVAVVRVDKNHASSSDWGQRRCIPVEFFLRYLVSHLCCVVSRHLLFCHLASQLDGAVPIQGCQYRN